jgi:TnpA family transposase
MSPTAINELPERILSSHVRRHLLVLPEDPTDEELARHWTLSEADKREVRRCRGEDNRRRFALQLCALRTYGRFVPNHATVPVRLLNYLGRQLDLPPILFLPSPRREATDLEQEQRIRTYLQMHPFGGVARERLEQWLTLRAQGGLAPQELYHQAEEQLRHWQVILPGPSTLERLIGAICVQTRQGLFAQLALRLSPEMQEGFDALLQVRAGESQSTLAALQQYPPEATPTAIKAYIDRYHRVRDLGVEQIDLSDIRPGVIEHLALLTRRYDVRALRRFPSTQRYPHLRRYLPAFYTLPFAGEPGTTALQTGLQLVTQLDAGMLKTLPEDAPTEFVPAAWWPALRQPDGTFDLGGRDAIRTGSLYLPASRRHVSFWKLVYEDTRWAQERDHAYGELAIPRETDQALGQLRHTFDTVARQAATALPNNPFVTIQHDRLRPKRDDALDVPPQVKELRRVIETHLPHIRIEELLMTVDRWCGFTQAFTPLSDAPSRSTNVSTALLAALIAHGTNLGVVAMGNSAIGVSVDMLQHISSWFLREETLKAANAILVNYHHTLELSSVWGQGLTSSSDGQRFALHVNSLVGSLCPRYFGYYDRALTVYTHLSDQWSVYGTRIISCTAREALYVLDGLLDNDTVLQPKEHYTDTHGFTEQLFGLCYLLGFSFMPRTKDLKDQQLYNVSRTASYGPLDPIFRATIDLALIAEQWDPLVRIAASLWHRTAPADVVLKRLAGGAPSDRLAKALTALGRVLKTIHILRYVQEIDLRHRIQRQLNRGELRHKLARRLFFANQGAFQTRDYEEMMNKASCLSLLCNAVLVWNTVHMSRIIEQLRATGVTVTDEDVALISPLAYAHVIPNGTYFFDHLKEADTSMQGRTC